MKKILCYIIVGCLILTSVGAVAKPYEIKINDISKPTDNKIQASLYTDEEDQNQTVCEGTIPVGKYEPFVDGAIIIAQSFTPQKEILTRIEIYMSKNVTTTLPCYLSIREELDGPNIRTATVLPGEVDNAYNPDYPCENLSWEEFDFIDLQVTTGELYYMVIYTVNLTDNLYWVAGNDEELYPDGNFSWTLEGHPIWETLDDLDGCFKTYGYDNTAPDIPDKPTGPSSGETGVWYTFYTTTTDPDGNDVKYGWDIDHDGVVDDWSTFQSSGTIHAINIRWWTTGTFYIRVKAEDIYGSQSDFSLAKKVIISEANDPPNTPDTPSGPTTGKIGLSYTYTTNATDPDGDTIRYGWDWDGDETVDEWTNYYSSGTQVSTSHIWVILGEFNVSVIAEDEHGKQSSFSAKLRVTIVSNNAPNKPDTPSGPTSGRPGVSYTYSTSTIDPDGEQVYYKWDWGDEVSDWDGPYNSGDTASASHIWTSQGTYPVKVMAKDISDTESVWSDSLSVSLPKNKNKITINPFMQFLSKWFPNLYRIIEYILQI